MTHKQLIVEGVKDFRKHFSMITPQVLSGVDRRRLQNVGVVPRFFLERQGLSITIIILDGVLIMRHISYNAEIVQVIQRTVEFENVAMVRQHWARFISGQYAIFSRDNGRYISSSFWADTSATEL